MESKDEPLIGLDFFGDSRISGLLGAIVALSGEVMVLKAEVKRLTVALQASGATTAQQIEAAGETPELRSWMDREAQEQARAILRPILVPDEAIDVRHLMKPE